MAEQIIYIAGPAVDADWIDDDQKDQALAIHNLQKHGAEVAIVGNAITGFSLDELEIAFRSKPNASTVIVDVHGNISGDEHYMVILKNNQGSSHVWATDFYEALANYSRGRSLNVFLFSCGSGRGRQAAQRLLSENSTLFNLVGADTIDSYYVQREAFATVGAPGMNYSEALFTNILCNGLLALKSYMPHVSVSRIGNEKSRPEDLWKLAVDECKSWRGGGLRGEKQTSVREHLEYFMQEEILTSALEAMENFSRESWKRHQGEPNRRASVKSTNTFCEKQFRELAVKDGLLGPICAIAYFLNRDEIAAFQRVRPVSEHPAYKTPMGALGSCVL